MRAHPIAPIPGDGSGPLVFVAGPPVLAAAGAPGSGVSVDALAATGTPGSRDGHAFASWAGRTGGPGAVSGA